MLWSCASTKTTVFPNKENPWRDILSQEMSDNFQNVLTNRKAYELQILYTKVVRIEDKVVGLIDYPLYIDSSRYFYPASTVKLPTSVLAMQKVHQLQNIEPAINRNSIFHVDSLPPDYPAFVNDKSNSDGQPTIGRCIEEIFATSDNNAYNRLYEFLGQDDINGELYKKKAFSTSVINSRVGVSGFDYKRNKIANGYCLLDSELDTLYCEPERIAKYEWLTDRKGLKKGEGYMENGKKVTDKFDFSYKNYVSLNDLNEVLKRLFFPSLYSSFQQFDLTKEQREWFIETMAKYPSDYDHFDQQSYHDSYVKFFMYGDRKESIPDHIKIYNKVGMAYGYLTDAAYIVDQKEGVDFFLSATIHVNENQTYNDDTYEYDQIGIPFLAELGRLVHQYEIRLKNYAQE